LKKLTYIFLLFLIGCQGSKSEKEIEKKPNSVITSEEDIYTDDNFKDVKKTFSFEGQNFETSKRTIKIGEIFFTAIILPNEYYIRKNLKIKNKDSIKSYIKRFENEKIIQFDFQHEERKDLLLQEFTGVNYKKSVEYMSNLIHHDFYAITSEGDSIKSSGVLFERNFNLAPRKRLLLYFNTEKNADKLKLVYDDRIFKKGIIKFNLQKE